VRGPPARPLRGPGDDHRGPLPGAHRAGLLGHHAARVHRALHLPGRHLLGRRPRSAEGASGMTDATAAASHRDFEGRKALVAGGAPGSGRATAELLAARGARVAVLDLDPADVTAPLLAHRADVTDDASVNAAVGAAADALGGLDLLVNNAGIG